MEYLLRQSYIDGEMYLMVDGFVVAVFYRDGTFQRIRYVGKSTGLQLDNEGRIIEEIPTNATLPTIRRQ